MRKYRVQVKQYSNDHPPRTAIEEVYTEVVEAETAELAKAKIRAEGNPDIDADLEVLGEV
jgi:hypothetical protein